jgi:cell wall-associated NlpC family hydrolase
MNLGVRLVGLAGLGLLSVCAWAQTAAATETSQVDPNMIKVGRLGQSISETKIYSSMNEQSRSLWNLKSYSYLVINQTKYNKWRAVLLQNGSTGYILADKVAELPYDVEIPKDYKFANSRTASSSRGTSRTPGSTGRETGTPSNKQEMLDYSYKFIGTRYVWGGNSLTNGIDCSGFVQQLFGKIGVDLPRTAAEQAKVGKKIERLEDLQPGDRLYFWDKKRGKIGHTGIFLGFFKDGGAYFIHSSTNNKGVDTDDLRSKKWLNMLVAARR